MKFALKLLKLLLMIIGGFIAIFLLSVLAIILFFDPNDYKPQITQLAREYTNRNIHIIGDIEFSLYPWLGIQVNQISISNPERFSSPDFASAQSAVVRVKLLPLFSQQFEVDTVYVNNLNLNLVRQKEGTTNIDDFLHTSDNNTSEKTSPQYHISGIEIHNAHINWEDQLDNKTATLSQLTLKTSELKPHTPIELDIVTDINTNYLPTFSQAHVESKVKMDIEQQTFQFDVRSFTTTLPQLPQNLQELTLSTQADLDLPNQTLAVNDLLLKTSHGTLQATAKTTQILSNPDAVGTLNAQLEINELLKAFKIELPAPLKTRLANNRTQLRTHYHANLEAVSLSDTRVQIGKETLETAKLDINLKKEMLMASRMKVNLLDFNVDLQQLKLTQLFAHPNFQSQLTIEIPNLGQVLKQVGQTLPATKDKKVLQKLTATTSLSGNATQITLEKLALHLDNTKITGKVAVALDSEQPNVGFNLNLDQIDLDRYLPPESKNKKQTDDPLLALDTLRNLRVNGKLHIGQLKVANTKTSRMELNITAKNGKIKFSP